VACSGETGLPNLPADLIDLLCFGRPGCRFRMAEQSIPKEAAYQIINDELMLDGNPRLNLASFVTTWMEPECDKLIQASVNKNYVDMDEYPVTTELQVRPPLPDRCLFWDGMDALDRSLVSVSAVGSMVSHWPPSDPPSNPPKKNTEIASDRAPVTCARHALLSWVHSLNSFLSLFVAFVLS
jgi:hypothetical protein